MSKGEEAEDEVKPLIRKEDMGLRALPQEHLRGHRPQGVPSKRNQTVVKEGLMNETSYRL